MPALTDGLSMIRPRLWAGVGQSRSEETVECPAVVSAAYPVYGDSRIWTRQMSGFPRCLRSGKTASISSCEAESRDCWVTIQATDDVFMK